MLSHSVFSVVCFGCLFVCVVVWLFENSAIQSVFDCSVQLYVCMCVCMYVFMYVCMYVDVDVDVNADIDALVCV